MARNEGEAGDKRSGSSRRPARDGAGGGLAADRPCGSGPNRAAKPGLPARLAAARLLGAVVDARTALDGLTDDAGGHPHYLALDARDRSLVRAILLSALRHRSQIDALIAHRLDRPLPDGARSLVHHLHVGAAQVLFLDVPDSAAVDLCVEAVGRDPRAKRFAALANALMRRLGRERARIEPWLAKNPPRPPEWLAEALRAAYGERTDAILAAHAHEAPLDLTPNPLVREEGERTEDGERLEAWPERTVMLPTGTLRLERPDGPVPELAGFTQGAWWVQDAASALPVRLFGDMTGRRALDLCAAPGGKTAQMIAAGARVMAVEINANRARRLSGNLERLGMKARIVVGDALKLSDEDLGGDGPSDEEGGSFDAVLLDAPCSSTGTIRRHPDVAWTKTPDDVAKLADLQLRLLGRAAGLVAPGGLLVFSNCSLLPEEGEEVLESFLSAHSGFRIEPIVWSELASGVETEAPGAASGAEDALGPMVTPAGTLRTTPDMLPAATPRMAGLDGFYAARLRRVA